MPEDVRRSTSGFETPRFTGPRELAALGVDHAGVPDPGQYPFTRGFDPDGYRRRLWGWEMYAGFGSADDTNARYRFLEANGATGGISIALDLPTQLGFDSDHEMSAGEVGRVGVALDSYADVERLFDGVDLARAGHIFTTANCIAPVMYAWVLTYCERHGVDPSDLRLQVQNDPIKEYVARGTHFLPIESALRLATDVVAFSHGRTPGWLPISVSGSHMKQAGASPAEEAAFTIANAVTYMEAVEARSIPLAAFNPTLELHFCTDMDFFEEVAKYRAVRRAWSEIATERFGVSDPSKLHFRLHAATSGLPLTAQQPLNNIARITLQALAQVLGGIDAGRTASWDEALAIPTEGAAAVSLRINQIIAHETNIAGSTDPLGGSFYVEELTERIYRVIVDELTTITELGGAIEAVRTGYYADRLARGAYEQQRSLDAAERIVVGVNAYQDDAEVPPPRFQVDPEAERRQVERLLAVRARRDATAVTAALGDLADACASNDNTVPATLAAVQVGATIGEIADVWRATFGEFEASWATL